MGGMQPEYFMRHLRQREAEHYLEGVYMRERASWEQSRMVYNLLRGKDSEPMKFPWDTASVEIATEEDILESQKRMAEMAKKLNNHG